MADTDNIPKKDNLSEMLAGIMSDPAIMEKITDVIGGKPQKEQQTPPQSASEGIASVLSNPELMAKLPEVIEVLRPMLSGDATKAPLKESKYDAASRRTALLFALKPYLSPHRCEAIDYIVRISKMGDLMKNIKL